MVLKFTLTHVYSNTHTHTLSRTQVPLAKPVPWEAEKFMLLTMVVSEDRVEFYRNVDYLGNSSLPRIGLTDCFNGGEGTLIGDPGLELGVVRYYPFSLTLNKIEEVSLSKNLSSGNIIHRTYTTRDSLKGFTVWQLFKQGGMLNDISTGTEPQFADTSQIGTLGRSLGESITKVDLKVQNRKEVFAKCLCICARKTLFV
jgi:hypothetical protein